MRKAILTIDDLLCAKDCVFFDAAQGGTVNDASYFFTDPNEIIEAWKIGDVLPALEKIEKLSQRYWLAGYIRYEAGAAFLPGRSDIAKMSMLSNQPLLWFGVYSKPLAVDAFDAYGAYVPLRSLKSGLAYENYEKKVKEIKIEIKKGNTYQVNFTFDFFLHAGASPEFLYAYLRDYQRTPYCAFIKNSRDCVLSFSPELFFHREGPRIWTCPMKGTISRGMDDEEDIMKKDSLRNDEKNRAENLMIVDLLRNDLGKIAVTGTVRVPSMFDVETHPTLHQMTSLIEAELKPDVGYARIFHALFPCGSVTGAPKIKTMKIIERHEEGKRGVYCGAIGYLTPEKKAVFSVPIRILQKQAGAGCWQYRAGSGIVWDSQLKGEWDEVRMKAAFLTAGNQPDVCLLETLLWKDEMIVYEKEHVERMRCSAKKLKFVFGQKNLNAILTQIKKTMSGRKNMMLRLLLTASGVFSFESFQVDLSERKEKLCAGIADRCLDSENIWLQHKTTYRPWYEKTMEKISNGVVWDELFFNERGELCEGARSNVFIKKDNMLYTPPVSCGLLPGILRDDLLKTGRCEEKILTRGELFSADAVYCGNSVRGLVKVDVMSNR